MEILLLEHKVFGMIWLRRLPRERQTTAIYDRYDHIQKAKATIILVVGQLGNCISLIGNLHDHER